MKQKKGQKIVFAILAGIMVLLMILPMVTMIVGY